MDNHSYTIRASAVSFVARQPIAAIQFTTIHPSHRNSFGTEVAFVGNRSDATPLTIKEINVLVLTRKPEQKIHIGNNVTITVLEVKNNKVVRLGIEAPREIRVFRGEIVARMVAERSEIASPLDKTANAEAPSAIPECGERDRLNPQTDVAPLGSMRRRVPGALTPAPLIRPPQRLGPTSLRAMAMLRRS